jgi:hypothetical protein
LAKTLSQTIAKVKKGPKSVIIGEEVSYVRIISKAVDIPWWYRTIHPNSITPQVIK